MFAGIERYAVALIDEVPLAVQRAKRIAEPTRLDGRIHISGERAIQGRPGRLVDLLRHRDDVQGAVGKPRGKGEQNVGNGVTPQHERPPGSTAASASPSRAIREPSTPRASVP